MMIEFGRRCLRMSRMRWKTRDSHLIRILFNVVLFRSIIVFMAECRRFQIFEALKVNLWLHHVLLLPYHIIVKLLLQIIDILHFDLHLWRLLSLPGLLMLLDRLGKRCYPVTLIRQWSKLVIQI